MYALRTVGSKTVLMKLASPDARRRMTGGTSHGQDHLACGLADIVGFRSLAIQT